MNEIICPHCHKAFTIDEAGYADILKQIRDKEFKKDVQEKLERAEEDKANALKLAEARYESESLKLVASKESEINELKSATAKSALDRTLAEAELKSKYENELKDREAQIERLRDMKLQLSTKMLGETLEQHCQIEFDRIRATAFPRAYFEKDNKVSKKDDDTSKGSKGDFIFRDSDESANEIVSIMFEMKNEGDDSKTTQRNETFFAKLDKDRNEKGCEYAVLVTMLEPESELYNVGIVDVSHRFPKMYVVRPQFFIQIITLLRNAALNAMQYKAELALARSQSVDITNFEQNLKNFQEGFSKDYTAASKKLYAAVAAIDKSILELEKTKKELMGTEGSLQSANKKAQDVSIKKLTKGNPTMAKKFEDLANNVVELEG
jgi:hypothetical protein